MATAATTGPSTGTLRNVNDNQKRWMVFGLALKVLVDQVRSFVAQEIQTQYDNLKTSHGIDTQSTSGRLKNWPTVLKYENINGNDAVPKVKGKHNYSAFDCRVTSHVDFARLYLENHVAKFTAFDEQCDASAVLNLLGKVPVFSGAVQSAAVNVRQARNVWAHCAFIDWNPVKFHQCFVEMEQLVKSLGLLPADENNLLTDLKEWESKGTRLCMNITMDTALLQLVQQHVNALKADVDKVVFEVESDREAVKKALQGVVADLNELEKRVSSIEQESKGFKRIIQSLQDEQSAVKSDHEYVQQRVTQVEEQLNSAIPQITFEIANCEADITFFADRYDPDTRQWLFEDFDKWFNDPGDSRAYVLLGDAGVGKSVIAGALAQREKDAGHLGAAYFCRHNDGTRNDPRYLLGTVACQLCNCSIQYSNLVGGEGGVRMTLANSKLGVLELFTKLLQEPLGKCTPFEQKKLVIIDALDETEYESREDFLDLIMHCFPRLPKWLVFFVTSRPEDTVQFRLKKYNPCIKICAGNGEHLNVYQQHQQDIQLFLKKRVDFSRLPYSVEDLSKKCSGLFLYAFYIVKLLNDPVHSGKIDQLSDLFPGDIDTFFLENFQRVFNKVGAELYRKLFGCLIAAPSPLPLSFISFILKRERSNLDEQEVIDAVSQFVVLRVSDQTCNFLHNLIPSWLTDKNKASRRFFVDRIKAGEYLREIIVAFLPAAINDGSKKHPSIENDFFEYVLRVGVCVLCGFDEKDSMKIVYSCLTSYQFIQRRIQNSRIELYSVIGDYKLSARCQALRDAEKQILKEIRTVLESNIYTLLECPHLLPSCLRNASKDVQSHMAVPDGVSTTWMEWSWLPFPASKITHDKSCFALSPDEKLLAQGKGKWISLFDSRSLEMFLGPIEVEEEEKNIKHLAFSADGNFVFFGRLDRWLSVERRRVEKNYQFNQSINYYGLFEWGSFTLDKQYIVVKRKKIPPTCPLCLFNHLCLWAKEEIAQTQESEQLCSCFPHKVTVERRFPHFGTHQKSPITAMRPLLDLLRRMRCDQWCSLLEKVEFKEGDGKFLLRKCNKCKSLRKYKTLTLIEVRQFIVKHYSVIFEYQVWNVKTGKSVLEEAFSSGVGLSPFTYFCHLGTVFEICGTLFTGVNNALSFCNVALLNAICHHLLNSKNLEYFFRSRKFISPKGLASHDYACLDDDDEESVDFASLGGGEWCAVVDDDADLSSDRSASSSVAACRSPPPGDVKLTDSYDSDDNANSALETVLALSTVSPTMALEMQNLPDEGKKALFSGNIPCILPGTTWVATPRVNDKATVDLFLRRDQNQRYNSTGPVYVIKKVAHFGFTNDFLFFLYLTVHNSLHALSLQTGTILQSVSGVNPVFIQEKQVGYIFQNDHEDKTLFLNVFPGDFLEFFLVPFVRKPIQATFVLNDAFLVLFEDSKLMLFRATGGKRTNTLLSESFLKTPCGTLCLMQVKKGEFSPNGNVIAVHHDKRISV